MHLIGPYLCNLRSCEFPVPCSHLHRPKTTFLMTWYDGIQINDVAAFNSTDAATATDGKTVTFYEVELATDRAL